MLPYVQLYARSIGAVGKYYLWSPQWNTRLFHNDILLGHKPFTGTTLYCFIYDCIKVLYSTVKLVLNDLKPSGVHVTYQSGSNKHSM